MGNPRCAKVCIELFPAPEKPSAAFQAYFKYISSRLSIFLLLEGRCFVNWPPSFIILLLSRAIQLMEENTERHAKRSVEMALLLVVHL